MDRETPRGVPSTQLRWRASSVVSSLFPFDFLFTLTTNNHRVKMMCRRRKAFPAERHMHVFWIHEYPPHHQDPPSRVPGKQHQFSPFSGQVPAAQTCLSSVKQLGECGNRCCALPRLISPQRRITSSDQLLHRTLRSRCADSALSATADADVESDEGTATDSDTVRAKFGLWCWAVRRVYE